MIKLTPAEFKKLRLNLGRVLPRKRSPLQKVHITLYRDGGILRVTNLDEFLSYSQGIQAGKCQEFCVEADVLKKIQDNLKGKKLVLLSYEAERLKVTFRAVDEVCSTLTFPTSSASDVPVNDHGLIELKQADAGAFCDAYKKCSLAVSRDESRLALNGVFYSSVDYALVATNGRQLIVADLKLPVERDILLPTAKSLQCSLFSGTTKMGTDGEVLVIESAEYRYSLCLKREKYPDYRQVIPNGLKGSVCIAQESLAALLQELCSLLTKSESISLCFLNQQLFVAVQSDVGITTRKVEASFNGEAPEMISVNIQFLREAVSICDEDVKISFNGEFDPIIIASTKVKTILMPMRGAEKELIFKRLNQQTEDTEVKEDVKKDEVTVAEKVDPLKEIFAIVECLERQHKDAREKADLAVRAVKECQGLTKALTRQIKLYERDVSSRLKGVKHAEDLVAKLQKLVA